MEKKLYAITRALNKSRRTLTAIVEHRITTAQVTGQAIPNTWAIRAATAANANEDQDVDMNDDETSPFRFHHSTYSPAYIEELRSLCEMSYVLPMHLRKPTEKETESLQESWKEPSFVRNFLTSSSGFAVMKHNAKF